MCVLEFCASHIRDLTVTYHDIIEIEELAIYVGKSVVKFTSPVHCPPVLHPLTLSLQLSWIYGV